MNNDFIKTNYEEWGHVWKITSKIAPNSEIIRYIKHNIHCYPHAKCSIKIRSNFSCSFPIMILPNGHEWCYLILDGNLFNSTERHSRKTKTKKDPKSIKSKKFLRIISICWLKFIIYATYIELTWKNKLIRTCKKK